MGEMVVVLEFDGFLGGMLGGWLGWWCEDMIIMMDMVYGGFLRSGNEELD